MFCKVPDEALGAGDARIHDYDPVNKLGEIEAFMRENYPDQVAFIMDFVSPNKSMGVHAYDILTITKPDGSIQVVSSQLWSDCGNNDTSHDCNSAHAIDLATGTICGGLPHYSSFYADEKNKVNKEMVGKPMKYIEQAVQHCIEGHKLVN